MKKIALVLIVLIGYYTKAQEVKVQKGDIFKDTKKNSSLLFSLEPENGGLVTIRAHNNPLTKKIKFYYIQYFNEDLSLVKEATYKVEDNLIKNAFIKNNKIHLIEYELEKKSGNILFNAVSADLKNLEFSKKNLLNFSKKKQKKYYNYAFYGIPISDYSQKDKNYEGEVVLSENENYFVINFDVKNKKKESHLVFVFKSNFEKVYEQLIQINTKDKLFTYNSIAVDDEDGTVYFLGKYFEKNSSKSKKKGSVNFHFELYKVDANGQSNNRFKSSNNYISSLELVKYKNHLACSGLYGKKDFTTSGVCLFNINEKTLQIEIEKYNPFSEQFLTDKFGNKKMLKKRAVKNGLDNITLNNIHVMENGDLIVYAEEFYTKTILNGNGSSHTYLNYDDILCLRMNKEGDLKWARNINKSQKRSINSSYSAITVGENAYIIINCADKMKKISGDRLEFKQTILLNSNLYMVKIDREGTVDYQKIIDAKESEVYYKVIDGIENLKNKTIILTGENGYKTRILKLQF